MPWGRRRERHRVEQQRLETAPNALEFGDSLEVGALRRQPGNGLGNGGVLLGPVVASAGQDVDAAGIQPGVHPIPVKLYLVDQVSPSGAALTRPASCGLIQVGGKPAQPFGGKGSCPKESRERISPSLQRLMSQPERSA